MVFGRFWSLVVLAGAWLGASVNTGFSAKDTALTASGLPVPRYVSLKSDHVNVRAGPTKDNDVAWVYTRSGLPVEITAEFENWRRIRDSEGAEGWVYHSLLSGRRTAVITMKSKDELAPLYDRADPIQRGRRPPAGRRRRPGQALRGGLVPYQRQRLRRLDRTAAAVGRLRRRKSGLRGATLRAPSRLTPPGPVAGTIQRFLRSRTTMSTRAIS